MVFEMDKLYNIKWWVRPASIQNSGTFEISDGDLNYVDPDTAVLLTLSFYVFRIF